MSGNAKRAITTLLATLEDGNSEEEFVNHRATLRTTHEANWKDCREKLSKHKIRTEILQPKLSVLYTTKIKVLDKTKIFVNHVISIKYNVSTSIVAVLEAELDKLAEDVWRNGHFHLKVYPQTDPPKSFTAARLFGESLRDVTGAKTRFEKLLVGDVVIKDKPL